MEVVSTCSCLGIVDQPPIPIISYNHPQPLDLIVIIIAIIVIFIITSSSPLSSHPQLHHTFIIQFPTTSPLDLIVIIIAIFIIVVATSPSPISHTFSNHLQFSASASGDYLSENIPQVWGYLQWYWERQISLDENISWWQEEISAAISRNASVAGICALPSSNCSLFRGKRIQSLSSSSIGRGIFSSF